LLTLKAILAIKICAQDPFLAKSRLRGRIVDVMTDVAAARAALAKAANDLLVAKPLPQADEGRLCWRQCSSLRPRPTRR
jgi:hypothetical protein